MSMIEAIPQTTGTYLIVLKDHLVALDLAESITCFDPTAEVIVRHNMAGALSALEATLRIDLAFVGAEPAQFGASRLARMISSRHGRVVLMGYEAEAEGEALGWRVLHRPFSQGLVLAHLADHVSA